MPTASRGFNGGAGLVGVAVHAARQIKHGLFVGRKTLPTLAPRARAVVRDYRYRNYPLSRPYSYAAGRYRRSFINWSASTPTSENDVARRVFCFWTGKNEITSRRQDSLQALRQAHTEVDVVLVTPDNLNDWVVPSWPLHPSYQHLSLVHRSDYLRAYFLHHHGGGYSDIKRPTSDWSQQFDRINRDERLWLLGYPERSTLWVAQMPGRLGCDLQRYYTLIPGGSAFIARANTQLTLEWLLEVERRLDYYAPLLVQNPGGVRVAEPTYPVSWNKLLAQVLHPLSLKFNAHVAVDDSLAPILKAYQ